MSDRYECNECGASFPEELTEYLEKGNHVYCETCGAFFSLKKIKEKREPKIKEEKLDFTEYENKSPRFFWLFLLLSFFIMVFIIWSISGLSQIIPFTFLLIFVGLEILEIFRIFKLFAKKDFKYRRLNQTITLELMRTITYSSSIEKKIYQNRNEKKALKIILAFMYINFIMGFYIYMMINHILRDYYSTDASIRASGGYYDNPFFFICFFIESFYFSIGLILLINAKMLLSYKFVIVISISQVIFYNLFFISFIFVVDNAVLIFGLLLFLDTSILFCTTRILTNKNILKQYYSKDKRYCHNCGTKLKKKWRYCLNCRKLLIKREDNLEEVSIQNTVQKHPSKVQIVEMESSSDKLYLKKEKLVKKESKPELITGEKSEVEESIQDSFSESIEDLSFLKEEKDKELFKKYVLSRFTVVSRQIRDEIDKLDITREAKIDLLKDYVFLTSKEQQDLLDLLVHIYDKGNSRKKR